MIKGEMEREIAGCLVRALADGCQRPAILDLVQEIVPAVKMARIRLPDGELATGFGMIVCYAERFVEVRLGHM